MSVPPSNQPTVQRVLNGSYDLEWLKLKARHDLAAAMTSAADFYYNAANFAVSVGSMADWAYLEKLNDLPAWTSVKVAPGVKDFTAQVAAASSSVAAFSDLSNEFKHFDRTRGSATLAGLAVYPFASAADLAGYPDWLANSISQRSNGGMIFVPVITLTSGDLYLFRPFAEESLRWWDAFDPAAYLPTP